MTAETACLDPSVMFRDPDKCKRQMKCLVQTFLQDKQLTGGVSAGRNSYQRIILNILIVLLTQSVL